MPGTCPTLTVNLDFGASGSRSFLAHDFSNIVIPPGATHWRVNVADHGSSFGTTYIQFRVFSSRGAFIGNWTSLFTPGGSTSATSYLTLPTGAYYIIPYFYDSCDFSDHCDTLTATATIDLLGTCSDTCAYGSEPNPSALTYTVITLELIQAVAEAAALVSGQLEALPFIISVMSVLVGVTLEAYDCSVIVPQAPALDLTSPDWWTFDNLMTWFRSAAWSYFCRCTPAPGGSPPPVPPSPPVVIPPSGGGGGDPSVPILPQPPLTCDGADLCTVLNGIVGLIQSTNGQLAILRRDVQLIQRQAVPFAYIYGPRFSGLSGTGTVAVQGILGLSVVPTVIPPVFSASMAPVNSYYRLGELSFGTADGWVRRQVITHSPHLILDLDGDISQVAYAFETGVVADIQTLIREP